MLIQKFSKKTEGLAYYGEGGFRASNKKQQSKPSTSKTNHSKKDSKDTGKNKSKYRCFGCGEKGHLRNACPEKQKKNDGTKKEEKKSEDAVAIVAESNCSWLSSRDDDGWIQDSGCTEHMSYNANLFKSYKVLEVPRPVYFGDGNIGHAIAEGDIEIEAVIEPNKYRKVIIKGAWHVPEVKRNLISQTKMMRQGNMGEIRPNTVVMHEPNGRIIFNSYMRGGLLHLWLRSNEHALLAEANTSETVSSTTSEVQIWHERLAHNNQANIERMSRGDSVLVAQASER